MKWIEFQELAVLNPVYAGPGSGFIHSPWFTLLSIVGAAFCFYYLNRVISFR